jgi:hypothetical protein
VSEAELVALGFKPGHLLKLARGLDEHQKGGSAQSSRSSSSGSSCRLFTAAVPHPGDLPLEAALAAYGVGAYAAALRFCGVATVASLREATAGDTYSQATPEAQETPAPTAQATEAPALHASRFLEGVVGVRPFDAWQLQRCAFGEPPLPLSSPSAAGPVCHSSWATRAAMVVHVEALELQIHAASLVAFEGFCCPSDPLWVGTWDEVVAHELDLAAANGYAIPPPTQPSGELLGGPPRNGPSTSVFEAPGGFKDSRDEVLAHA